MAPFPGVEAAAVVEVKSAVVVKSEPEARNQFSLVANFSAIVVVKSISGVVVLQGLAVPLLPSVTSQFCTSFYSCASTHVQVLVYSRSATF